MRPFIAACAACISTICVHPLDTLQLSRQLSAKNIDSRMAGCIQSASSAFLSTGVYFGAYEQSFKIFENMGGRVAISTFIGTFAASIPMSILNVKKKRAQAIKNKIITTAMPPVHWPTVFMINLFNKYPKTLVKYSIYEYLLTRYSGVTLVGFLAGFVSSIITALLFEPFEAIRTFKSLSLEVDTNNLYNGLKYGILSSTIANTLGHGILEKFAPR